MSGKRLARLPVDPRIGRMLLAAGEHHCLREILIVAAALSVQDPRERPDSGHHPIVSARGDALVDAPLVVLLGQRGVGAFVQRKPAIVRVALRLRVIDVDVVRYDETPASP